MNEPANFCTFPCDDPEEQANRRGVPPLSPPPKKAPRQIPGFPRAGFQLDESRSHQSRSTPRDAMHEEATVRPKSGLNVMQDALWSETDNIDLIRKVQELTKPVNHDGNSLLYPPYRIHNYRGDGDLSSETIRTDIQHANGFWEYDVHNLYGAREYSIASVWHQYSPQ